jgi:chaperonin GroES
MAPAKEAASVKVKPLHDRVIVQRVAEESKTAGGIIIPDSAKEKPQEGKVIAVGDGRILDSGGKAPLAVKAGDRILFGKYSGTEIKIAGEEYLIMREEDILGIIQK